MGLLQLYVECFIDEEEEKVFKWFQITNDLNDLLDPLTEGTVILCLRIGFHEYTQMVIDYHEQKDEAVVLDILNRLIEENWIAEGMKAGNLPEPLVSGKATPLIKYEKGLSLEIRRPWDFRNPVYCYSSGPSPLWDSRRNWKYVKPKGRCEGSL
ncbi:MAG: hypothetical protein CMA60_05740 [Euryarchaeota archaeon]|nr:hypothetical protein [Euryarchaeota archaeon]|tara:strand:- start:11169 stop:11630 length:462 start_codon:yes stop_codon:yes gene_type:complete